MKTLRGEVPTHGMIHSQTSIRPTQSVQIKTMKSIPARSGDVTYILSNRHQIVKEIGEKGSNYICEPLTCC